MDNELDKRIADLSADIVLEIDQTWLLAIESRRGAFERFGKHGDVGPALNEISKAVGGTARQDCKRDACQKLDLGLLRLHQAERNGCGAVDLDVCPSRACEKKHQNGKRRCTRSFAEYGHSVMQSRWRRRRHVNSHESYPMKTIDEA